MTVFSASKILQSFPSHYYVIDCKTYQIVDTNNPKVKKGETTCFKQLFNFDKPCNEIDSEMHCTCKEVLEQMQKVEMIQKVKSKKGFVVHKVIASPIFGMDNKVDYIVAQYIDLSDVQIKEDKLNKLTDESEVLIKELKIKNKEFIELNKKLTESNVYIEKVKNDAEQLKDFFENIIEAIQEGIWVVDKKDIIYYTNPAMEKISGIPRVEILNKNIFKDYPKETVQVISPYFNQAKNELKTVWYEISVSTRSRKSTFHNGWLIPLIKKGQYNGMICTVRDVTDHVNAKQNISESEEKYRALYNNAPLAYQSLNIGGFIIDVNPQWLNILGYERNEVIGKWFGDFLYEDSVDHFRKNFPVFKSKGKIKDVQFKMRKKAGTLIYVAFEGCIGYSPEGKFKQTYCTFKDITKEIEAKQNLIASEEKYRRLTENSPTITYIYSLNLGALYWSSQVKDILGLDPEKLKSDSLIWTNSIHQDDRQKTKELIHNIQPGEKYELEYRIFDVNNKLHWFNDHIFNVYKKDDDVIIEGLVTDITTQKKIKLELIENEKRYQKAQQLGKIGNWEYNILTGNFWASNEAKRIFGFSSEDELFSSEYVESCIIEREKVHQSLIDLIEKGKKYDIEFEIIPKGTTYHRIITSIAELVLDKKETPVKIVGFIQDITERKHTEIALKESEERYRKLFESTNVGIGISTIQGDILTVNDAMIKIFGYGKNEFEKLSIYDLYVDLNNRKTLLDAIELQGKIQNFQIQMKRKNGKYLWITISAQSLDINKDNQILFVITDITKEKLTEIQLLEQENKFRTYIESSPIAVFITNEKAQYIYVNEAATNLLGYSKKELLKMSIPDLQLKENLKLETKSFEMVQKNGFIKGHKSQLVKKNEQVLDIDLSAIKLSEKEIIAYCTDITPLKNHERDLKEKNEEYLALNEELEENIERIQKINNELKIAKDHAEESDHLKSAFLANMSHEIRTPLNGILGFSALLQKKELTNETSNRYSSIIESCGKRLLSVVNDVFDISLIQSNQLKVEKSTFAINDLMNEVLIFYQTVQENKIQTIDFRLIKASENEIKITNDKYRLHQIFKNLIDNAFKFTSKGEIEFGYLPLEKNKIIFYVKDTGIGIPDNFQKTIFSPFRQVDDSITRDYDGAGLGLSISAGLLDRMGGEIWVESALQSGTTFYFSLPLNENPKSTEKQAKSIDEHKNLLKNKLILIVEDDIISYEFLRIFLEDFGGIGIIQTSSGNDAVNIVEKNKVDLIFMDIRLPDMDGYETTRKIRKNDKKVKIIAQTAYAFENDKERALNAGCNDYITKPLKTEILVKLIKKYFV